MSHNTPPFSTASALLLLLWSDAFPPLHPLVLLYFSVVDCSGLSQPALTIPSLGLCFALHRLHSFRRSVLTCYVRFYAFLLNKTITPPMFFLYRSNAVDNWKCCSRSNSSFSHITNSVREFHLCSISCPSDDSMRKVPACCSCLA